ncbi:MAG TPA: hypothetical protein VGA13_06590 [Acidimicrobiales bacterium]
MTVRQRATWLAAPRLVPLPAMGAVTVIGCVAVVLVVGTPDRLRAWVVLTGVVLAAVAASAVDDPTESVAASAPVARRPRWTARVATGAVGAAPAVAVVAATGAMALSDNAESVVDVLDAMDPGTLGFQIAAYLMIGWAVGAAAVRHWGPGSGVRCAGPAVFGFHLAVEATGHLWPRWLPGAEMGTTGWWRAVLGLATVAFLLAATDPARRLSWRRRP